MTVPPQDAPAPQATKPVPINPQAWLTDDDYPAEALKKRQEGTAEFRLDVSAQGGVTKCTITRSSGHAVLDGETCRLVGRGRFKPARDASGTAVPSTFDSRFRWSLPVRG
jgi:protein TonB